MAIGSGIDAQFGFGQESAYGTVLNPVTRFLEFNSESLSVDKAQLESHAIGSGLWLKSSRVNHYIKGAGGDIEFDVMTKGFGLLFEHCLGQNTVAQVGGTAEYTHTIVPTTAGLAGKYATVQIGRPDVGGTIRPFNHLGGKVIDWELSAALDEIAKLKTTWDFQTVQDTTALATKSFASGAAPFIFAEGALTIGAVTTSVRSASVRGHNALNVDRRFLGASTTKKEPIANDEFTIMGDLDAEFESLAAYDAWIAGTQAQLILTFTSSLFIVGATPFKLTVTVPAIFYTGSTPNVGGPDIVRQSRPWKAAYNGTNPIITVLLNTSDTAS